jgi:hypothetical protein
MEMLSLDELTKSFSHIAIVPTGNDSSFGSFGLYTEGVVIVYLLAVNGLSKAKL